MNQVLRITAVVAAFVVILVAGAVIGGVVMVQVARSRFERFAHQREAEQHERQVEQQQREAEQRKMMGMIGSLRQQLQQVQQQGQMHSGRGLPRPEQFGPQLMQRFVNQIQPTPEQREKIRPLVNQAAEDLRRLRRDTTHSTELILEHLEDQITAVLDPGQRDRFNDMIQRWRDAFQRFNSEMQQRQAQQRQLEQQGAPHGPRRGGPGKRGGPPADAGAPPPPPAAPAARDDNLPRAFSMAKITITGAIKQPGSYDPTHGTTLYLADLIAQAGGVAAGGDETDVRITLSGDPTKGIRHVDLAALARGAGPLKPDDPTLQLHAGDMVFVPDKRP